MTDLRSLRSRIGLAILAVALVIWVAAAGITIWITQLETGEILDGQLIQSARLVAALPTEEFEEYEHQLSMPGRPTTRYEPDLEFQVWNLAGKLIFASMDAPPLPRPDATRLGIPHDHAVAAKVWRAVALENSRNGHVIQVMAYRGLGLEFAGHVGAKFMQSAILVIPLALLLATLAVRATLRPIERLRVEVATREPGTATPIATEKVPTEVAGLIDAINGLAKRHVELLDAVRRFSEDAAHELRTPIAAIRAHAQVALGETTDEWQRAPLEHIEAESARIGELLAQLLTMGQLGHVELGLAFETCDLGALAGRLAAAEHVEEVMLPGAPCLQRCVPSLIEIALANLLRNARKHGGGRIRVEVSARPGANEFAIEDNGPGVPAHLRETIFEPFVRGPGTRAEGSGLGLSIVRRIAAIHGAAIRVEEAHTFKGARLVFTFG